MRYCQFVILSRYTLRAIARESALRVLHWAYFECITSRLLHWDFHIGSFAPRLLLPFIWCCLRMRQEESSVKIFLNILKVPSWECTLQSAKFASVHRSESMMFQTHWTLKIRGNLQTSVMIRLGLATRPICRSRLVVTYHWLDIFLLRTSFANGHFLYRLMKFVLKTWGIQIGIEALHFVDIQFCWDWQES